MNCALKLVMDSQFVRVRKCFLTSIFLAVFYLSPRVHGQATVSLLDQPDFQVQRGCLQACFNCYECGVFDTLGCWYNRLDSCFCRADLASSASSAITSCVLSNCSGHTPDVSRGVSLYDGYCSRNQVTLAGYADPTLRNGISIGDTPDYKAQRPCLQACFGCYECGVIDSVGCWYNGKDACFCRKDLATMVSTALTACVNSNCSGNQQDLASAVSLYNGYCHVDGATLKGFAAATTTTGTNQATAISSTIPRSTLATGPSSTVVSTFITTTDSTGGTLTNEVVYTTQAPPSSSDLVSQGGLSTSDRIAIGVGLGIGIPTLILMVLGLYLKIHE